ncbi:MAG: (2Fe-2S)-binding protein [Firmicutes bacterium]|nr:(2Fe-2S)-binding protein [Bacillota bacterium]
MINITIHGSFKANSIAAIIKAIFIIFLMDIDFKPSAPDFSSLPLIPMGGRLQNGRNYELCFESKLVNASRSSLIVSTDMVSETRMFLSYCSGAETEVVIAKYVCYCNHVSEQGIINAIKAGAKDVSDVVEMTGVMKNSN